MGACTASSPGKTGLTGMETGGLNSAVVSHARSSQARSPVENSATEFDWPKRTGAYDVG
jgi:hypothetical protein